MVRVLKDSFKNALSTDRKKTENVLRSLSSFLYCTRDKLIFSVIVR